MRKIYITLMLFIMVIVCIIPTTFAAINATNLTQYCSFASSTSLGSIFQCYNNLTSNGTRVGTTFANLSSVSSNFNEAYNVTPTSYVAFTGSMTPKTAEYGISLWFKRTGGANSYLFGSITGGSNGYLIEISGATITCTHQGFGGTVAASAWANDANWHSLQCMRNSTGTYVFVDGVQGGTIGNQVAPISSTQTTTALGARYESGAANNGFTGLIDEFYLYNNRSFTATEIAFLSDSSNIPPLAPPLPTLPNASISVYDNVTSLPILTYLVQLQNGSTNAIYQTSNGSLFLPINTSLNKSLNITVISPYYFNNFYTNYNFNTSGNLNVYLIPQTFSTVQARDVYSNETLSNFSLNITTNYSCTQTDVYSTNCNQIMINNFGWSGNESTDWTFTPSDMNNNITPYATVSAAGAAQFIYWNMSKPNASLSLVLGAILNTGLIQRNISIPFTCFVQPFVQIRMLSNFSGSPAIDCYDGSVWQRIYNASGNSAIGKPSFFWGAAGSFNSSNTTLVTPFYRNPIVANYSASINLTSSQYGGYFNVTFEGYNFNVSGNLLANLTQAYAQFNASELFTNSSLSGGFITINSTTLAQGVIWNLSAGIYAVTYTLPGYFSITQNFTILPLTNLTYNFTNVSTAKLTVTVASVNTGIAILSNITVDPLSYVGNNITALNTYNYTFNLMNGTYTLTVEHPSYILDTRNLTLSVGEWLNLTIWLTEENNFTFFFFDEQTLLPLANVSWYIADTSGIGEGRNGTSSYNLTVANLTFSEYEMRYNASGYQPRSYFFSIPATNLNDVNVSLYDVAINQSESFFVRVTDNYNNFIPNLTVSLLRRYVVDQQTRYYVVEQARPMQVLGGNTLFSAVPNVIPYLFRVENAEGEILFQGSAKTQGNYDALYFVDSQMYIQLNTDSNLFIQYLTSTNQSVLLQSDNNTNSFWLSFADISPEFSQTCLNILVNDETIDSQCSTARDGILSYTISNFSNTTSYLATATIIGTGTDAVITLQQQTLGSNGVPDITTAIGTIFACLFAFVALVVVIMAFAGRPAILMPSVGLIVASLGPMMFGFTWISAAGTGVLLIGSIILALVVSD